MSLTNRLQSLTTSTLNKVNEARNQTYYFAENVPIIDAQITTSIPDTGIAAAILASTIENEEELKDLQEKFKKIKKHCKDVENTILKYQSEIQKILAVTNIIRYRMQTFESLILAVSKIVPKVKMIVKIARGIIALQVSVPVAGGVVSGAAIIKQKEIIDAILAKLEEVLSLQMIFESLKESLFSIAEEIEEVLLPIQNKLSVLNSKLAQKCNVIDLLFIQVLSQIDFNNLGDRENEEYQAAVTISGTLEIEEIIDNLELSSREKFFIFLKENGHTGYRIINL